jgi:hypothetical protein
LNSLHKESHLGFRRERLDGEVIFSHAFSTHSGITFGFLIMHLCALSKTLSMAVLISVKVKGQTQEGYDGVLNYVRDLVKKAPGFILHCSHPDEDGWALTEVWHSKKEADLWYATYVVPNLPPGIHPKRSYQELHSIVTPNEQLNIRRPANGGALG